MKRLFLFATTLLVIAAPCQLPAQAIDPDRPVSWKLLAPNLVSDQKNIWTFPARIGKSRNWIPAAVVLGTTSLIATEADPKEARYFRRTTTFNGFNNIFNSNATEVATIVAPVSLYAFGLVRRNVKLQHTALLAGESAVDCEILTTFLKDATKRARPADIPINGNFAHTWWQDPGNTFLGHGSFPSGHTIAAFSIATIFAKQYRNHRWVPLVAYGGATLIGFSRLTLSAHYLSDVFMGGALGYSISNFTVLRH